MTHGGHGGSSFDHFVGEREQFVWDLLGRAQGGDGAVEIASVPKDDGRDQQVQPARCCWFS